MAIFLAPKHFGVIRNRFGVIRNRFGVIRNRFGVIRNRFGENFTNYQRYSNQTER